jgi:hypothetical protein
MKRIGILLLSLLFAVGLVACNEMSDPLREEESQEQEILRTYENLQAYKALVQEMRALSEYAFSMEVSINVEPELLEHLPQPEEDGETDRIHPVLIRAEGTMSLARQEMQVAYMAWYRGGRVPRTVNKQFTEDAVYMDLNAVIVENAIGEVRHTRASFARLGGESFSDLASRLPILPPDTEAVSRRGNALFVVTLNGREALEPVDDILELFTQFATVDEDGPAIGELAEVLRLRTWLGQEEMMEPELTEPEPEFTISIVEVADGFQQRMVLRIPRLFTMRVGIFYAPQIIEPLVMPQSVFTWEELQELMADVSAAALLCWERKEALPGDFEVVYDLEELNLVNHILPMGSFFEEVPYESVRGNHYIILEPIYGVGDPEGTITHDGLRLLTESRRTNPLLQLDAVVFIEELTRALSSGEGRQIAPGPIRTNPDRTIAFIPIRQPAGMTEMSRFFMTQVIPDSGELILLEFWVWTIYADSLSEKRHAAIVELGQHVGIDFIAFLDGEYVLRSN